MKKTAFLKRVQNRTGYFAAGIFIMILLFYAVFALPVRASEKGKADRTVKVGWYIIPGAQEMDENGNPGGYGYEYLKELSNYTGLQFEYVRGTYKECTNWMQNGQVDMMLFMQYTPERSLVFDYSETPIGQAYSVITCLSEQEQEYTGYKSLEGKNVAILKGTTQKKELEKLEELYHFNCRILEYNEMEQINRALNQKRVDYKVYITMSQYTDDEVVVEKYNLHPNYVVVSKLCSGLLEQVNQGLSNMEISNSEFGQRLYERYFETNQNKSIVLTTEERNALDKLGTLYFYASEDGGYASRRLEDGTYTGIRIDVIDLIAKRLNVDYQIKDINTDQLAQWQENTNIDFVSGFYFDYYWAKQCDVAITTPYLTQQYYKISNKSSQATDENGVIALLDGNYFNEKYIKEKYPDNQIILCSSREECLDMVNKGKADFTFMNVYMAEYYLKGYRYGNVNATVIDFRSQVCFAGRNSLSPAVISAVNKAIESITTTEMDSIILKNTSLKSNENSILDVIYENPILSVIITVLFVLVLAVLIFFAALNGRLKKQNSIVEQARQKAEQATSAKTEFLSRVSHDIRTPMNAIIGMTAFALEDIEHKDRVKEELEVISASSHFLLGLVNDILDMSKIESGKMELHPEPYTCEEFITNIRAIIMPLCMKKNITFQMTVGSDRHIFLVDKVRFEQIFFNLLSNAVKFTPEGGRVELRVSNNQIKDQHIPVDFAVSDNGIGMSEEFQKRMFKAFEQENTQVKTKEEGTGLGLTIVKNLVELFDGEISVKSSPGEGSTFYIHMDLPVLQQEGQRGQIPQEQVQSKENSLEGKLILLCEDHPMNIQIAQRLLIKKGCKVICAQNGQEGVNIFETSRLNQIDAILMDIRMPVMDGIEAAKRIRDLIREDAKTVPIIAMTADAYDEDRKRTKSAGMDAHLTKPIDAQELYETLLEIICSSNTAIE